MMDSVEIDRRVQLLYSQWQHPAPQPVGPLRGECSADIAAGTAEVVPPLEESTCLNNTSSLSLRCSDLVPDRDPNNAPPRDAIWHLSTVQHNPEVMHTAARLWLHLSSQFEKRYHLCAEELESLRMRHEQELSRVMDVANEMAEGTPSHSMGADISSSSRVGRGEDLTHPPSSSLLPSWLQRSLGDRWTGRRRSVNKDAPPRGHEDVTASKGDANGVLLSATLTQNVVQRHELELQELIRALREDLVQTEAQLNENFLSFLCVAAPEFLSQSLAVPSSSSRSDLSEAAAAPMSSSLQQPQQLPLKSSAQGPLLVVRIVNPLRGIVTGARPKDPSLAPIIFEIASLETLVMFLSLANAPRMQQQQLLSSASGMKQMDGAPTAAAAAAAVVADTPPLGESQQQEELAKTLSAHLGRTASGRHGVLLLVGSRDEADLYLDKAIGLAPELLLQPSVPLRNAPPFSSRSSAQSDSELFSSSSSSSALRHSVLRWTPWATPMSLQPYGTMYGGTTTQLHHVQIVLVFEPHSNSASNSSSLRLNASVAHALCLDVVARALRYNAWNLNVAVLPSLRKQQQHPQQPLFATLLLRELRLVLADVQMQDTSLKSPATWGCNVSSLSQRYAHNSTTAQLSSVQCGAASTSTDPVLTRLTFNLTMAVRVFLDAALRAEGGTLPLAGFGSSSPTGRRTTLSPAAAPRVSGLESLGGALVEEILVSAFEGDVDVIARV